MELYEKYIKYVPEFFKVSLNEDNFEDVVFGVINKIFGIKSGYIFFINSDNLSLKFSYNSNLHTPSINMEYYNNIMTKSALSSDLCIEQTPFAKFVVILDHFSSQVEVQIFESVSAIVSNLVKDLELNAILNMQVEALREGMNELTRANKKISRAEKTKNEFFANVSHQLRSPLNSIIGFTDILNSEFIGTLNEKQKEYISDIKISGIKLLEMVNEILDISKIESKSLKLFKRQFVLSQNIYEVLNILKPLYLQKRISVNVDISEEIILFADYQKLQQVFFNLISNAIKFTPYDGLIKLKACIDKECVFISVIDNGIGIDKKNHKKIFKKFYQAAPHTDGSSTGLGLPIANEVVKLHGGNISLISEPGNGAEFIVKIPYC